MRIVFVLPIVMLCVACGGSEPKQTVKIISVEDYETQEFSVEAKDAQVQGLLGNVTQDEIERVFNDHRPRLMKCYEDAVYDLEEIEGTVRFEAEVPESGNVESVFISQSDVGSIETEGCMLDIIKGFRFHRAPGGVAVIYYPMELVAPYDHPGFIDWSNGDVADVVDAHRSEVSNCLGGRAGVTVTAYIGKGGAVLSAGAAASSADAYGAAVCVARAVRGWRFPDPDSEKLAKLSLDF